MKLTEHRHSCGKRKLRERETVSVSYDTLRCIYIYIYQAKGICELRHWSQPGSRSAPKDLPAAEKERMMAFLVANQATGRVG